MSIIQEEIEKRAYELYLTSGREEGKALNHWLDAELEQLLESLQAQQISNGGSEKELTGREAVPAQVFRQAAD